MLFARIKPIWLFLLLFVPLTASGILAELAEHYPLRHHRFLVLSLNLSTFFAMIFVCWILTLVYVLAPTFRSKFLIFFGMTISILFRIWQDNFNMELLNATGKVPTLETFGIDSPIVVMHAIVSLFMITTLILLPLWLLKKEQLLGFAPESKAKTIAWFFVFPIGIWFIQPRMRKILEQAESQA